MHVYHGTNAENAEKFVREGIDGHRLHQRCIGGSQDAESGLFVTPTLAVARRFGLYIIEVDVDISELEVPPMLRAAGANLESSLSNPAEPQALIRTRIEPHRVRVIESHPNGYPFNPQTSAGTQQSAANQ